MEEVPTGDNLGEADYYSTDTATWQASVIRELNALRQDMENVIEALTELRRDIKKLLR